MNRTSPHLTTSEHTLLGPNPMKGWSSLLFDCFLFFTAWTFTKFNPLSRFLIVLNQPLVISMEVSVPLHPSGAPPHGADGAAMSYQPVIPLKLLRVLINSSNTETSVTRPPVGLQECGVTM